MKIYFNECPPEILEDNTLLFHGTSNLSESAFEGEKIEVSSPFSLAEINQINQLYEEIDWCGIHGGGYAVLSSFSITGYFEGKRKMYFWPSSERVTPFASRDFAGGELLRSVFYALEDLFSFAGSEQMQHEHIEAFNSNPYNFGPKFSVDIKRFVDKVLQLKEMRQKAKAIRERYQYGIVYGFRFEPDDYKFLEDNPSMGISFSGNPPKSALVVKIILPAVKSFMGENLTDLEKYRVWKNRLENNHK